MKLFFSLLGVTIVLFAIGIYFNSGDDEGDTLGAKAYTSESVLADVEAGTAEVLDVRTPVEFDLGHIVVANSFNVEKLKVGEIPDIDKDKTVYVYCRTGSRSAQAKSILENSGFNNVVDLGGLADWEAAGGELVESQLKDYQEILADLGAEPLPVLGDEDADLTIIKYYDHVCPFCMRFTVETEAQLIDQYVDSGKVKYEFRNVAYQGDESAIAAAGGYCANEYDLFWDYQTRLAEQYAVIGPEFFTIDNLVGLSTALGADEIGYRQCLESGKYDPVVSSETLKHRNQGIESTPAFDIGGQILNGALPLDIFRTTIDAQL